MNVVDSSAWLEYFADGPNADAFAPAIEDVERLVVPFICVYEVFRRLLQQRGESAALEGVAVLLQGRVVELDASLAMTAGRLGHELGLPLADSVVYATSRTETGVLWTQDSDFESLEGVEYVPRRESR